MKLAVTFGASTVFVLLLAPASLALDVGVDVGAAAGADLGVLDADVSGAVSANAEARSTTSNDKTQSGGGVKKKSALGANAASNDSSTNGSIEIDEVISLIANSDWGVTSLPSVTATTVQLIDANKIMGDSQAEFDAVTAARAAEISRLQAALEANASLSAWLRAEEVSAGSVVALGVKADGTLALITAGGEAGND